jgi:hypothetical protein
MGLMTSILCLLPILVLSQTIGQSPLLAVNASVEGLEVVASLSGAEAISIDIAGPGIGIVHTESKESSLWLPTAGFTDGSYRFEVQLVDEITGKAIDRLAGFFQFGLSRLSCPTSRTVKSCKALCQI